MKERMGRERGERGREKSVNSINEFCDGVKRPSACHHDPYVA